MAVDTEANNPRVREQSRAVDPVKAETARALISPRASIFRFPRNSVREDPDTL